jgi:hypothetical protein
VDQGVEVDPFRRAAALVGLDAAERQKIVDQARHALRLAGEDRKEAVAGRRIVARGSAKRLDEAEQRGERRAELVGHVGDEVAADLSRLHDGRHVLEVTRTPRRPAPASGRTADRQVASRPCPAPR